MNENTTGALSEGVRKLIMIGLALVVFGAIVIAWIFKQPEGLTLESLATWTGGIITTLTTLGVGGNVLEHKIKAGASGSKALDTTAKLGLVLLVVLLLPGCGGSGPVTVGDLLPGVQVARDARGCLALEIAQPVPVEGYEVTNTVKVRQEPGASGNCRDQADSAPTPPEEPQTH